MPAPDRVPVTRLANAVKRAVFRAGSMRPMSRGYTAFRTRAIEEALDGPFPSLSAESRWGYRLDERIIEYPWLFSRLPERAGTLLDAGSALNFDYLLRRPSLAAKKVYIATLAPEAESSWARGVSYVYEDLRRLSFRDGWFDWVASLSTIEHIGMDNTLFYSSSDAHREAKPQTYLEAVRECRRVLKPGGTLFLTVPYGKQTDLGWFQLFDGSMLDAVIEAFKPAQVREDHFRYEPTGWVASTRAGSAHCTYSDTYRTQQLEADGAAAARGVACLELSAP